jgi:hypothetical protein
MGSDKHRPGLRAKESDHIGLFGLNDHERSVNHLLWRCAAWPTLSPNLNQRTRSGTLADCSKATKWSPLFPL